MSNVAALLRTLSVLTPATLDTRSQVDTGTDITWPTPGGVSTLHLHHPVSGSQHVTKSLLGSQGKYKTIKLNTEYNFKKIVGRSLSLHLIFADIRPVSHWTEQAVPGAEEVETLTGSQARGEPSSEECCEQQVPAHLSFPGRSGRESRKCSELYFCIGMNAETKTWRALSIGKLILYKLCVSSHLTRKESVTKILECSIAFSHRNVFVDILFKDLQ